MRLNCERHCPLCTGLCWISYCRSLSPRNRTRGSGMDPREWQAAQAALGLAPAGHAIDAFFLCLLLAGFIVWGFRLRPPLHKSLLRFVFFTVAGIILLIMMQVCNNRIFDHYFTATRVVSVAKLNDCRKTPLPRMRRGYGAQRHGGGASCRNPVTGRAFPRRFEPPRSSRLPLPPRLI